jgi:hypothetical protein
VRADYFDEGRQLAVRLRDPRALRPDILVPDAVLSCQHLVTAPKYKAQPSTEVTFSLNNDISVQHDPQRLIDHDHKLPGKTVDLQEVISPGLIAIDGIIAGERTMLTPSPFPLPLIVMEGQPSTRLCAVLNFAGQSKSLGSARTSDLPAAELLGPDGVCVHALLWLDLAARSQGCERPLQKRLAAVGVERTLP